MNLLIHGIVSCYSLINDLYEIFTGMPPLPGKPVGDAVPTTTHQTHITTTTTATTMDLPVYMHNGCSFFCRSARLMLHHLRTAHGRVVAPYFADGPTGLALLDGQISEVLLSTSPPGTLSHICLTCDIVLGTRFDATTHLTLPQHLREYTLALNNTGEAGLRSLMTRRYLRTTEPAESAAILAPETPADVRVAAGRVITGSPGQLRYLQTFYTAGEHPASTVCLPPPCVVISQSIH